MNPLSDPVEYTHDDTIAIMHKKFGMSFCCRSIGMKCSFEADGATTQELMKKFIDHAETSHNMQVLTADVIFQVQKAIKK